MLVLFLLTALPAFAFAQDSDNTTETPAEALPLFKHKEGDVCNLQRAPQITENPAEYLVCLKPVANDAEDQWPWNGIGIWVKKTCGKGKVFSPVSKSCKKANAVRRQYINSCNQFGGCNQQYQPPVQSSCGSSGCQGGGAWTAQQPAQWVPPQMPSPCQDGSNCGQQQPYFDTVSQPLIEVQPIAVQPLVQSFGGQNQGCGSAGCTQTQPQPCVGSGCGQVIQPISSGCQGSSCGQTQGCGPSGCQQQQVIPDCGQGGCGQTQGCGPQGCTQVQPQPIIEPQPCVGQSCGQMGCQGSSCGQMGCQGSGCGQQVLQPRPCPGASTNYQNIQTGSQCSWMSAPLVPAQDQSNYYQCQPSTSNVYCGQWQQQSCGSGQVFNPQVQVCTQPQQWSAPQQNNMMNVRPSFQQFNPPCTSGTVPIGQCNVRNQCPGFSTCQQETNTCCQPWQG